MFFAKLVRLGFASMYDCRHNRARIYHLHQKALYRAIDDSESRLRRPLTLNHAIQRLMVLDAIVASPELVWLGTAEEKAAHLTALTAINPADLPHVTIGEGDKRTVSTRPGRPSQHRASRRCTGCGSRTATGSSPTLDRERSTMRYSRAQASSKPSNSVIGTVISLPWLTSPEAGIPIRPGLNSPPSPFSVTNGCARQGMLADRDGQSS